MTPSWPPATAHLLEVHGDLTTAGGTGASLVQGVQTQLSAMALSVKPGGHVGQVVAGGRIATAGEDLATVELDGEVGSLVVASGIHAQGRGSDGIRVQGNEPDPSDLRVTLADGGAIVHVPRP